MRKRRVFVVLFTLSAVMAWLIVSEPKNPAPANEAGGVSTEMTSAKVEAPTAGSALNALDSVAVKGRAPKTDYKRSQFGDGWQLISGCDTRNIILRRDLTNAIVSDDCKITSGTLNDPYTGKIITFVRGESTSALVQIDHVVALSNAWQTGAQQLSPNQRVALANDPLELLAVDGSANQQKSDGDAATWLPPNKPFRCQYVARQIAVKIKYQLWMTIAEKQAIQTVLEWCPNQTLPA